MFHKMQRPPFGRMDNRPNHHPERGDDEIRGEGRHWRGRHGNGPEGDLEEERGGHGRHQPPHGERTGRARRGESKYLIMDVLAEGAKNGYEIIKRFEERSSGRYAPSPGVVYPTLQLLADANSVIAEQIGERRVFHLTDEGRTDLEAHKEDVAAFWAQFSPTSATAQKEIAFVAEDLEFLNRSVWGALRGVDDPAAFKRVRAVLQSCREAVRSAATGKDESETTSQ